VHATLALSTPGGTGQSGLGQPETGYATFGRPPSSTRGSLGLGLGPGVQPSGSPGERVPRRSDRPWLVDEGPTAGEPPASAPAPPPVTGTYDAESSPLIPAYPRGRGPGGRPREQEPDAEEQEPGPAGRGPEPDGPGEEKPRGPGGQEPRGPALSI
jgi:hypothetical protein